MTKNKAQARPGNANARRGADNRVILHCRIDPATMTEIKRLAEKYNISQGLVIDRLAKITKLTATATRAGLPGAGSEE